MVVVQKVRWLLFEQSHRAKKARWWLKAGILVALFAALFWIVPFSNVIDALRATNLWLFSLGFFFGLLASFFTALEMFFLVRRLDMPHSVFQIFSLNLSVKFYTMVTPTTLVGSGVRWIRLAQPTGKLSNSLAAMFFFRALETFLTVVFGAFFWIFSDQQKIELNGISFFILFVLAVFFWIVLVQKSDQLREFVLRSMRGLVLGKAWQWFLEKAEKFMNALAAYRHLSAVELSLTIIAGLASLLCSVLTSLYLARALNLELTFMQMGWINSVVLLVTQLPFAGIGGLGTREVGLVTIMPLVGVLPEQALAFSFLLFVKGVLFSLLGGVVELVRLIEHGRAQ